MYFFHKFDFYKEQDFIPSLTTNFFPCGRSLNENFNKPIVALGILTYLKSFLIKAGKFQQALQQLFTRKQYRINVEKHRFIYGGYYHVFNEKMEELQDI